MRVSTKWNWVILLSVASSLWAADLHVRIVPISDGQNTAQGYASGEINAVSFRINSIMTVGDQQFAAFYEPDDDKKVVGHQGKAIVARRQLGSSKWELFRTNFTANSIGDAHDVISIGIDGAGFMHMGWGMHVDQFHYAKTIGPVTGTGAIEFGPDQSMTGAETKRITYPEFYTLANGDLLFFARLGVAGNGDVLINRYSIANKTWTRVLDTMIQGQYPKMVPCNAYWNNLGFDSKGGIICTWLWRAQEVRGGEKGFETNHDLMYARTSDEGKTWNRFDGTPYELPITQKSAEVIVPIPQGSGLMNQTSMAIDANDRPVITDWWAPGAAEGKYSREYMLAYSDGKQWKTSQITHRASPEPKVPEQAVRDLARPIVVIDKTGRVLVVIRYKEEKNRVMVAYSEDRTNWKFLTLDEADMGKWEPTYDMALWKRENKLHILYEPCGLGKKSSDMSVLEWDEKAYFEEAGK